MIQTLSVRNFKSIKHLKLACRRINIFIGEPNAGKSNLLEVLGFLSFLHYGKGMELREFVRYESVSNLFYDDYIDQKIEVAFDGRAMTLSFDGQRFKVLYGREGQQTEVLLMTADGPTGQSQVKDTAAFKFYRFRPRGRFPNKEPGFLKPPSGDNLLALLLTNKGLKTMVGHLLEPFGLKLGLRPQEGKIEFLKYQEEEATIIAYPYSLVSDTLQRVIFYLVAAESNRDSILVFEEPEAHAFPYYTKFLAERIALDERNNQYFISTHNPYFLLSVIEKAPKKDVNVVVAYHEEQQTRIRPLTEQDLEEILDLDMDVFFNAERFLEAKG